MRLNYQRTHVLDFCQKKVKPIFNYVEKFEGVYVRTLRYIRSKFTVDMCACADEFADSLRPLGIL